MRKTSFALCLALWLAQASAQTQPLPGADLASLLEQAKANNAEYAVMRHEASAAQARIAAAGALPDPKLQIELRDITKMGEQDATLNPSRVGSTRYLLMQDLPWFGKRDLRSSAASAEAAAAERAAEGGWRELAAQIEQLHVQRYFLTRNTALSREVLTLMQRLEQVAQARYAGAMAQQQDVIRVQVEQSGMRNELLMLENEARMLDTRLNALLNRQADAPLAEAATLSALPVVERMQFADLYERLRSASPLLRAEGARVEAASHRRELAYRERYPDFAVGVAPIQIGGGIRDWELMLQLNIPLQQNSRRGMEGEANAMLMAARARQEAAAQRLAGELGGNLAAYQTAQRSERLIAGSLLPQTQLSYQAALAGYENGKLDFSTLLDAQRQISQTRINLLKAQAEQHLRRIEIERILGETL